LLEELWGSGDYVSNSEIIDLGNMVEWKKHRVISEIAPTFVISIY